MKHLKLFFALFAMLALGVGNAWGAEETYTYTFSSFSQGSPVEFTNTNPDLTITLKVAPSGQGNTTKPQWNSGSSQARVYAGGTMSIAIGSGTITKIVYDYVINASSGTKPTINGVEGTTSAGTWDGTTKTWTGSDTEVLFSTSGTKGNVGFKSFKITYSSSTASDQPSLSVVTVSGTPTKTIYETGEVFVPTGLTVTGTYGTGAETTQQEITSGITWTANNGSEYVALENVSLTQGQTSIQVKATVNEITSEAYTANITVNAAPTKITFLASQLGGTNDTYELKDGSASGVTYKAYSYKKGEGANFQFNGKDGKTNIFYNTSAMPGAITTLKAVKASGTDRSVTPYVSTAPLTKDNYSTAGIALSAKTVVEGGTVWTISEESSLTAEQKSAEYKYFYFHYSASGALYVSKFEVAYKEVAGGDEPGTEEPVPSLTQEQFSWSAATATATLPDQFDPKPTLTNTENLDVTYSSSNEDVAKIDASGNVILKGVGTADIKATAGDDITFKKTTVYYILTVNKAPATPTDNVYVKVTTTAGITDGEYLIVYEDASNATPAPLAFNGDLATLDAAKNTVAVEISNSTIAGNTDIDAALFTIDVTAGTLKSASGKYIGVSSNTNGLKTEDVAKDYKNAFSVDDNGNAVIAADFEGSTMSLRYNNTAGDNNLRFRYYKNAGQQPIALYKKVDPNAVVEPIFTPVAGEYYGIQSVTISCATAGAEIYYTLDGSDPTSSSTKYTTAISISETKTLKAIAIKGENSSSVTEATYTILAPLATMQEIFDKATAVGGTATPVKVAMNNWVVTGATDKNVYVTDGTKGFIIYKNDEGHGFNVGDVLSGTVACKVQLYNGSAELTELTNTTEGLTVTTSGTVTPVEVDDVTTLNGVNTGSVIKITGTCESGNVVAGVKLHGTLYTFDNLTVGNKYNVTGVYLQYGEVEEILPRKQEDIEEVIDIPTATIAIANITMEVGEEKDIEATITPDAAQTTVQYAITAGSEYITLDGTTITAVAAGTATITATIAEVADEYYGTTKTFTVTVKPQNIAELPFEFTGGKADIENTLGMSQEGLGGDYTTAGVTTKLKFDGTDDWVIIHFNGQADKLAYDIKGNGFSGGKFTVQQSSDGSTYTDVFTYTELGDAATKEHELAAESRYVKFIYTEKSSGNVGLGNITISGALPTYTLTLVSNPDEIGATLTGAGTYKGTQDVKVTASHTDADWVFAYWTLDEEVVSYDAEYTFRLGADMELVANFEQTTPTPTPDYTRTVTPGNYGTICLPFGATSYTGMELYEFVGKEEGKADLASVTTLKAGVPYIFLATANELAVYSDGTTVTEAGNRNGLHGTFTNDTEVAVGNYILKDNKLCQAAEVCYVNANRAYIVWGDIPTGAPQQMPGRKYISMDVQGENETTSVEDLFTTDAPVKVVENAQLIIIRGGEKYNVQGQKL